MKLIDPLLHSMQRMGLKEGEQIKQLKAHGFELTPTRLYAERVRLGLIEAKQAQGWSEEEDAELKALSCIGIAHQAISDILFEKFGTIRSKGAVIGRFRRLGITKLPVHRTYDEPKKVEAPKPAPVKKTKPDPFPEQAFVGEGKPFNERACRWPLSVVNGEQTYCGCALHRKSYCEHHYGIAYRTA